MYKDSNYKNPEACFGTETKDLIVNVFDDWGTARFDWGTEIVNVQKIFLLITDFCEYDESIYQYLSFCYDGENCDVPVMMNTLLKKVFQVTTVANDIAQIFMEGIPTENDSAKTVEAFAERLGANFGKLLRYATDFDPSKVQLLY